MVFPPGKTVVAVTEPRSEHCPQGSYAREVPTQAAAGFRLAARNSPPNGALR